MGRAGALCGFGGRTPARRHAGYLHTCYETGRGSRRGATLALRRRLRAVTETPFALLEGAVIRDRRGKNRPRDSSRAPLRSRRFSERPARSRSALKTDQRRIRKSCSAQFRTWELGKGSTRKLQRKFIQDADNALATLLELLMSMGGGDHLLSGCSHAGLPLERAI
ncbi:hypothetical protein EVAR_39891_1 [Eumeta japonica]|uniref:Uncharacterized protein n=1 Tax=Eumeta variegata TaxID=151549 RepID=A0A4C1WPH9_EUMVA|nr:hypothetical protein EVAR_39891_1 [Eumeta japonica]